MSCEFFVAFRMQTASIHTSYLYKLRAVDWARHFAISFHCTHFLLKGLKKLKEQGHLTSQPVYQLMLSFFKKIGRPDFKLTDSFERFKQNWDGKRTIQFAGMDLTRSSTEKVEFFMLEVHVEVLCCPSFSFCLCLCFCSFLEFVSKLLIIH